MRYLTRGVLATPGAELEFASDRCSGSRDPGHIMIGRARLAQANSGGLGAGLAPPGSSQSDASVSRQRTGQMHHQARSLERKILLKQVRRGRTPRSRRPMPAHGFSF